MIRSIVLVLVLALAGCASEPMRKVQEFFQPTKAQQTLSVGLKQYEEGQYAESQKSLQSAIHLGLGERDRVNAHKHLAFIHCASSRERPCRDEFRKALSVDPAMDLEPEEAGHPVWGPIFRSVKAGR
jgi:Tfp pilus assembly protein PilF